MKSTLRQGLDTDSAAILYSVKCYLSAMLAYYIGLRIGLERPYWAMITCYVTASPQPLAGAILTKSIARVLGTVLGSAAAVALVPNLVNVPAALVVALSLWLGLCTYLAQLDRTPWSYIFVLAGYTASIVGFPSVDAPGTIFDFAVLRVQEIVLGILCTALLHGAVFPRTLTRQLQIRVDQILADVKRWLPQSPSAASGPTFEGTRRKLVLEVNELRSLSVQLPFDTARVIPRVADVDALRDRLTALLSLDPLTHSGGAAALLRDADSLRERIQHPEGLPALPELHAVKAGSRVRVSRRERVAAAWIGLGAAVSVAFACAIWIVTAWPSGSRLAIYVGIQCALFGGLPQGDRAVVRFLCGATAGIVAALLYAYTILPRVSDPVMLALTSAPILLVIGSVLARPSTAVQGVSASVGFLSEVGFFSGYEPEFTFSVNDSIALFLQSLGVDSSKVHAEIFGPAPPLTPGIAQAGPSSPHIPAGLEDAGPAVTFIRSGLTVHWSDRYSSLLELAEACSVPVRWSCRTGVCHNCESGLIDGRLRYSPEPLDPPPAGTVLICCAQPASTLQLDL